MIINNPVAQSTATQYVSNKRGKTLDPRLGNMKAYIEVCPLQFMQGQIIFLWLTVLTHVYPTFIIIIRASSQFLLNLVMCNVIHGGTMTQCIV